MRTELEETESRARDTERQTRHRLSETSETRTVTHSS
ncbi:hypothetical protein FKM82_029334 [Ascaphus truei]